MSAHLKIELEGFDQQLVGLLPQVVAVNGQEALQVSLNHSFAGSAVRFTATGEPRLGLAALLANHSGQQVRASFLFSAITNTEASSADYDTDGNDALLRRAADIVAFPVIGQNYRMVARSDGWNDEEHFQILSINNSFIQGLDSQGRNSRMPVRAYDWELLS